MSPRASKPADDSGPPFKIHKGAPVRTTFGVILALMGTAGICATVWANKGASDIVLHAAVEQTKTDILALKAKAEADHDLIVRIDENVKVMKDRMDAQRRVP
jgi:hypothetical protein